ncbi:MAG TPA: LapA family protein [Membranihabitans sp.]|nr:LapA family protein [Membranihabitans sp.]
MTIPIQQIFLLHFLAGQSDTATGLGLDILIYVVMAVGFIIIGFLASNFYNKARVAKMETDADAEKDRLNRRINTLEKEIKHLYAKDDERIVIINNLKKQLNARKKSDSSDKDRNDDPDNHLDLFSDSIGED